MELPSDGILLNLLLVSNLKSHLITVRYNVSHKQLNWNVTHSLSTPQSRQILWDSVIYQHNYNQYVYT